MSLGIFPALERGREDVIAGLKQDTAASLADPKRHSPREPEFPFEVGWFPNYESLFGRDPKSVTEVSVLLERAIATGRVLLAGRGGSGKTVVLERLLRESLGDQHQLLLLLTLKGWSGAHYDQWRQRRGRYKEQLAFLIRSFAEPSVDPAQVLVLPSGVTKVLLVDGLNEITTPVGHEVLEALEHFATFTVKSAVVVVDRLVRRELPSSDWQLATVQPLSEQYQGSLLRGRFGTKPSELLSSPYFMDAFLRNLGGAAPTTKAAQMREWFTTRALLTPDELGPAGRAACAAYEKGARSFPRALFAAIAGDDITKKLEEVGDLRVKADTASFEHHLKHDYLAALRVIEVLRQQESKDSLAELRRLFDVVSFHASSFDSLAMALEEASSSDEADRLVRAIYDWNQYGAAYAVAEAEAEGASRVTREMKLALFAVLAERRWDLFKRTAERASDALRLFPRPEADGYLEAESLDEIRASLEKEQGVASWFDDWRRLYTMIGSHPALDVRALLLDEDAVIGWTAANVLKRIQLTEAQLQAVDTLLANESPTVRWRAAHVLGAYPAPQRVGSLLDRLEKDDDEWVCFGATRSLVEMAARDGSVRREVRGGLLRVADVFAGSSPKAKKIRGEFQAALSIDQKRVPGGWNTREWLEDFGQVVQEVHEREHEPEVRRRWREAWARLQEEYGSHD